MDNADPTKNPANPKERYGDKKRRVDLVPAALELGAAVALAEGAKKYGPFNWRVNHVKVMTYVGAIKRHLACYVDGEDVDPESLTGKLHLEGIAACVAILLDSVYAGIAIDDRPKAGCAPSLCRLPADPQPVAAEVRAMAEAEVDEETAAGVADAQEQLSLGFGGAPRFTQDLDPVMAISEAKQELFNVIHHLRHGEEEDLSHCDDPDCTECPLALPTLGG